MITVIRHLSFLLRYWKLRKVYLSNQSKSVRIHLTTNRQEVALLINDNMPAGVHSVTWNASKVSSGIYFFRLQAGDFVQTRKMVYLK